MSLDFSKNLRAFLSALPVKKLSGHQKFLVVATYFAVGKISQEINVSEVRNAWLKSILGTFNSAFYVRAQNAGWVNPTGKGKFVVTEDGIQHLADIVSIQDVKIIATGTAQGLFIFDKKSTHSFDKFLRGIFAGAQSHIWVADAWVDETIFDNVLDSAQNTTEIKLLYANKRGVFDSRVHRFSREFSRFSLKRYSDLHDRFLVVDGVGYVMGPSIKDAASNSPAIVVRLGRDDSLKLSKFFQILWKRGR